MVELELRGRSLRESDAVRLAEAAEAAGLRGVCLPDGTDAAPFATASAIAMRTHRLGITASGIDLAVRSFTLVAMTAVTLSALAEGRFVLSLADTTEIGMLDAAMQGKSIADRGGFRLGGIEPEAVPMHVESTATTALVRALGTGVAGVVLHDATPASVEELATRPRAAGCRLVAVQTLSRSADFADLLAAGADSVRLVPPLHAEFDDLRRVIEELGRA